jgi:hypothetical protein
MKIICRKLPIVLTASRHIDAWPSRPAQINQTVAQKVLKYTESTASRLQSHKTYGHSPAPWTCERMLPNKLEASDAIKSP